MILVSAGTAIGGTLLHERASTHSRMITKVNTATGACPLQGHHSTVKDDEGVYNGQYI